MEQNLLHQGKLLDENGNLTEAGYHYRLVKEYSRDDIKASKMRIKEWDYYYIGNNKKGFSPEFYSCYATKANYKLR